MSQVDEKVKVQVKWSFPQVPMLVIYKVLKEVLNSKVRSLEINLVRFTDFSCDYSYHHTYHLRSSK